MNAHLCAPLSDPRDNLNNPDSHNPPRTHAEALRDLDYVIRLNQRHRRLYGRVVQGLRFGELIAGALGLAAAFGQSPAVLAIGGGVLALVAFAGFAIEPSQCYYRYHRALQRYSRVRRHAFSLSAAELDQRYTAIADPDYIEALRLPSFNDMMRSHGLSDGVQPLNHWQRLWAALA